MMTGRVASLVLPLLMYAVSVGAQSGNGKEPDYDYQECPCTGTLGSHATINVPAGLMFIDAPNTRKFLEANENPTDGRELGTVVDPTGNWFVVFQFSPVGYVSDEEKDTLDAAAILESLREGGEVANQERRKRGWTETELRGWHRSPYYDATTHNLVWATRIGSKDRDGEWVNQSVRLLGRNGVMTADLVFEPTQPGVETQFSSLLQGFSFKAGQRYAEFRKGDRVAEYGLTALIAGGAGAVLVKSGVLAKFWKLIVAGVIAIGSLFRRMFSRQSAPPPQTSSEGETR